MATRSFLTEEEQGEALQLLNKKDPFALSKRLGEFLLVRLQKHPLWQKVRPIHLGSWARRELCAKSDIDLLFIGNEEDVKKLVDDFNREGLKIRYRVPADIKDWSQGVEAFDELALFNAQAFFIDDTQALQNQVERLRAGGRKTTRRLFREMLKERKARAERYDSIVNYMEPNLKYGPGALRDLEQALMIRQLFPEAFSQKSPATQIFDENKKLFLLCRHYLHLHGGGDLLAASQQVELAQFFGDSSPQTFMTKIEKALAEVSFYADWVAEVAQVSGATQKPRKLKLKTFEDALKALKHNNSRITEDLIRETKLDWPEKKRIGPIIERYFNSKMSEEFVVGLFRSRLLSQIVPELSRLEGHVQHDQYHRYSVDAHTLQAVREVLRTKAQPRRLGRLANMAKNLKSEDWDILVWAALFHDLGKGLEGDHSTIGAGIVKRDFIKSGLSLKKTAQVTWLVQNHLLLSGAAFRQNPHSSRTWSDLFNRGVKGPRIDRLAVFTAIDIRATNPEALNDWKERLLSELTDALKSAPASRLNEFLEYADKKRVKVAKEFIENIDSRVVECLSRQVILNDYRKLLKNSAGLTPLVVRTVSKDVWVRFHSRQDEPGLFLKFVNQLHAVGISVDEAFVQTFADWGAYDWFKVSTKKPTATLTKQLNQNIGGLDRVPDVAFSVVEVVSRDQDTAVISFRGRDQRGALLAAAKSIYDSGLEIVSAKVHTWGRQIDDVFLVRGTSQKIDDLMTKMTL